MPTIIPTIILDALITEGEGDTTITELRTAQLDALPHDCPNCPNTHPGTVEIVDMETGVTSSITCPLCAGMGKTAVQYVKVCDSSHWAPVES